MKMILKKLQNLINMIGNNQQIQNNLEKILMMMKLTMKMVWSFNKNCLKMKYKWINKMNIIKKIRNIIKFINN